MKPNAAFKIFPVTPSVVTRVSEVPPALCGAAHLAYLYRSERSSPRVGVKQRWPRTAHGSLARPNRRLVQCGNRCNLDIKTPTNTSVSCLRPLVRPDALSVLSVYSISFWCGRPLRRCEIKHLALHLVQQSLNATSSHQKATNHA